MAITVLTSNESGANSLTDINANFSFLDTTKANTNSTTATGILYGNGTVMSAATISTGLTLTGSTITANLATGVSGGQSVIGGTASGNSLTLSSTAHATKGKILFGTSAYDEVNNRLGIGTASPSYPFHTVGNGYVNGMLGVGVVPSGSYALEATSFNFTGTGYFRAITYHFNGTNNYFGMQAVGTVNKIFTTSGSTNKDIVINPNDVTNVTFSADGTSTFAGDLLVTTAGTAATSVVTRTGTQTLTNKTLDTATVAVTQAALDSSTKIATTAFVQQEKVGYTLPFSQYEVAPIDSTTYYYGPNAYSTSSNAVQGADKIRIPKTGTIKRCYVEVLNEGVLGTTETSTISIRLNSTSDTTISASFITSTTPNNFSNTALSIAVTAGDYVQIKWVTPAWVTNPTAISIWGIIYIE